MQYRRVEEIASTNIIKVDFDATFRDAIRIITEKGVRNIVVTDEDVDLYAYIGVDEIVRFSAQKVDLDTPLSALGLHPLIVIPRRYDVFDASALFLDEISLLGVSNEDGSLFGVVSHFDVLSIGATMSEHIMDSPIEVLVLSSSVAAASPEDLLTSNIEALAESSMDCILVHEANRPVGIVTKRDITRLLAEEQAIDQPIRDFMSSPLITFESNISIREALDSIRKHRYKRIIVTREDGSLHGVITEKALINLIYSRLAQKTAIGIDRFNQILEKKLQEKVKENDELKKRYELALLASSDGVWDMDLTTGNIVFSDMWQENFGNGTCEEASCSIERFEAMVCPDDVERWRLVRSNAMTLQQHRFEHEYRLHRGNSSVWVKDRAIILYGDGGRAERIVSTTTNMSESIELKQALESYKGLIEQQALHDGLTGLPNRQFLSRQLEHFIDDAKLHGKGFAICLVDLDRFADINDSYGHVIGDMVIQEVASRFSSLLAEEDFISRLGGDEFVILVKDIEDVLGVIDTAQQLIEVMKQPFDVAEEQLFMSISAGITIYPMDGVDANRLLGNATAALGKAKECGRDTYMFYTEDMSQRAYNYTHMDRQVRHALDEGEFRLFYQPQIDAPSGRMLGMEALLRWEHLEDGLRPPDSFIPFLEESGLIVPVGKWILKEGMRQVVAWQEAGLEPGVLAINISFVQLKDYQFIEDVRQFMQETRCRPEWIEFEITESRVMQNPEQMISLLLQLQNIGIKLAVDDFGTGHSSLSYLKRLPISKVKIDRSFVMDVPDSEEDVAIIKAIIVLSKSLGLNYMAEGIETEAQKAFLLDHECTLHQGYFYDKPLTSAAMESLLKQ
jgi:diguanylate cyclase (GGDEF)-like protein